MPNRFLSIDEEGYVALDGVRVDDEEVGRGLLARLQRVDKDRFITSWDDLIVLVEAFDDPIVVRHVEKSGDRIDLIAPYGLRLPMYPDRLCLDEWDRFHGLTDKDISFVFSRQAQVEFFDLLNSFDDTSITVNGRRYDIPPYYVPQPDINEASFWTNLYNTSTPGWEKGAPAKPLKDVLPQLKLPKSRVLVLGCGTGQDAAYLAQNGHVVTGVDFSAEAIARAKASFGSVPGLEFFQQDIFTMKITGSFDLIFEHACYAAVQPERREQLIDIWLRHLIPGGHLLGIFFIMAKRGGPPFGNSEWELRERLRRRFRFLYWTRWRNSIPDREGRELVVYAQKL